MKRTFLTFLCILAVAIVRAQPIGPDAPLASINYSNGAFQFQLDNPPVSNNYQEAYLELDPSISSQTNDQFWRFQGYIVYQVIHDSVDLCEMHDTNSVRIAAVVDINDMVQSVNYVSYDSINGCEYHILNGTNSFIPNSINISTDMFTGQGFLEGQSYCFRVCAYATNFNHVHPVCNVGDFLLTSWRSPNGGIAPTYCVNASDQLSLSEEDNLTFSYYPNPVNQMLTVQNQSQKPIEVAITTLQGQLLETFQVTDFEYIDFSNYASGAYFLRSKLFNKEYGIPQKVIVHH